MLYKPDWEETRDRFCAWWEGELIDRCAIAVVAPRADAPNEEPPPMPKDPIKRWTDLDYIAQCNDYYFRRTFFGGEALPIWSGGYPGHVCLPTFLGCPINLDFVTGWWDPIFEDKDDWDYRSLQIDKTSMWWDFGIRLLERAAKEAQGKSLPSIGAFGACGDVLSALRGTMGLLYDTVDCPDRVREAEIHLMKLWIEVYEEFHGILKENHEGTTCWFPLWSPGKFYAAQCDFSYMISTEMFCDLFVPALEMQCEFLDHVVYHCDGVEAFKHIPAICDIPGIHAIQVLPGVGKPSPLFYMDSLKYVQHRGKNLHITISAQEVEEALNNLSPKGLFIETWCASEEEARDLIREVERWSCSGLVSVSVI